jgi:hypothetical protein
MIGSILRHRIFIGESSKLMVSIIEINKHDTLRQLSRLQYIKHDRSPLFHSISYVSLDIMETSGRNVRRRLDNSPRDSTEPPESPRLLNIEDVFGAPSEAEREEVQTALPAIASPLPEIAPNPEPLAMPPPPEYVEVILPGDTEATRIDAGTLDSHLTNIFM